MNNYIIDTNPFRLAGPPKWFLARLWDFDDSLVIVPSRQACVYRLAQRRAPQLSASVVNDVLFKESDTKMLASYNLIPVTTILATANWSNPFLFEELKNRAPWRLGGAEKVNKQLEDWDMEDEMQKQAKIDEVTTGLSKDAWKMYLKKIGVRSHLYIPKTA